VFATLSRHDMEIPLPRRVLYTPRTLDAKRDANAGRELTTRVDVLAQLPLFATLHRRRAARARGGAARDVVSRRRHRLARGGRLGLDVHPRPRQRRRLSRRHRAGSRSRTSLAELSAPGYFGEMGLLTGQARTASIMARNDVLCYRLESSGFDAILRARPEVVGAISQTVAERQAANDATLKALSDEARARTGVGPRRGPGATHPGVLRIVQLGARRNPGRQERTTEVRKHRRQLVGAGAEPARERGTVLIHRRRRNPAAFLLRVVGPPRINCGNCP
jgi:CRP-like cAMP-binding protein